MKTKIQFKSIRTRLTFWFMIVALLPLITVYGMNYRQRVQTIKAMETSKLLSIRDLKVREVNAWLDQRIGDVKTMADDHSIRALEGMFMKQERGQDCIEKVRHSLNHYIRNYKDYTEIFIINPASGKIEVSTNRSREGMYRSKDLYFTEPLRTGEFYIKDIYYSKTLDKPAMAFSVPIRCLAHGKHIVGILVAMVNLEQSLYALLLDRTGMGDTGETLIVNKAAVALSQLRWHKQAPLRFKIEAGPAVRASQGNTGIIETSDYRREKVLAAYTYIPRTGWGFVAKQDLKEIYAPVESILRNLLLSLLVSTVGVYVIAFFMAKNIAEPVLDMTEVAKRLQGGDSSARNSVLRTDEVGYLAAAFNNMADSVMSEAVIKQAGVEITSTMVAAEELKDFATELLKQLVETTGSNLGAFYVRKEDEAKFEHYTSIGVNSELLKPFDAETLEGEFGKVLATQEISRISNIGDDTVFTFKTFAGTALPKEIISIPLIVKEKVRGVISLASFSEYSKESAEILYQAWVAMNTAFSNLLANEETRKLARDLEAQSEELQSQSEELQAQSEELQAQNEELEVQQEQVEEVSRLKSEFLSNMSHELRTPLNSVLALSRVLIAQTKDKLSAEEANYLEIIERNGKNLLVLINDILDLSKIEAGKVEVSPKPFSLVLPIETVVESLESIAHEKGIELRQNIPDNLPQIESDEASAHQILQNIVGNAVKFTEKGSVTVSAHHDAQNVYVKVTDTGIGISEEDLPHIFEQFRQVDGTSARLYEGTGLGLAIVFKTAELLSGAISVESVPGKGSTFIVTLPIKWQGTARVCEQMSVVTSSISREAGPQRVAKCKTGKRILLVEDNEVAIIQVERLLEGEGYTVSVARGGEEALEYIKHKIPDGIILDLMMPKVDGFEVLQRIRGAKATANIPVLVLTAKDLTPDDFKKLSGNNVQHLIHKGDVDQSTLLSKTKLMLGEKPGTTTGVSDKEKKVALKIAKRKLSKVKSKKITPTILVVEDNPDNMITIKAVLQNRYNMLEATEGEEGLKTALTELPDLVLLDMALPKMDGFEVVRKIRNDKSAASIPVIALTAHAMKGDRERIIEAGCDDYIPKPIDGESILKKIEEWI